MILQDFIEIPEWVSLAVIAISLLCGIIVSLQKIKHLKVLIVNF
jgi:tellurite resistance protein TerC